MRSRLRHGGTAEGPGHRTGPFALEQAARIARTSSFWKKAVLLLNYACEASPTVATDWPRRPNARPWVCRVRRVRRRVELAELADGQEPSRTRRAKAEDRDRSSSTRRATRTWGSRPPSMLFGRRRTC